MEKSTLQIPQFDYERFFNLLWGKKWIILFIFLLLFIIWTIFAYKTLRPSLPELEATVTLVFDDPGSISALKENVGLGGESRFGIIRSRSFLGKIVNDQSLIFSLDNKYRDWILDSINVDLQAKIGQYKFKVNNSKYIITYTNLKDEIENLEVQRGSLNNISTIILPSIYIRFNEKFLEEPYTFSFKILPMRSAIDKILKKLDFKLIDRRGTLFGISLKGADHPLIAQVLNNIADKFVEQNLLFKKRKTNEVLTVLEKQLNSANVQLEKSQQELRRFQERYPWVVLRSDVIGSISNISSLEANATESQESLNDLKELQVRARNMNEEDQILLLKEILSYFLANQMTAARAMSNELEQLSSENDRLQENYADVHPLVQENREALNRLAARIYNNLSELIVELEQDIADSKASRDKLVKRLRMLPAKAQQLAELQRSEEINSKIYSSILVRFNEAKIADAVEVGDIYVLDYAVVPLYTISIFDRLKLIVIGGIFIFGLIIGFIIALDYFDKSVKNSKDIETKLQIPLLATIPVIGDDKEIPDDIIERGKLDRRLITSDYSPHIASEAFRLLRTKILMKGETPHHSIIIASINPGDGKSLVSANLAITFAQQKLPTILIDCDLRRGVLHNSFACDKKPGLTDILIGSQTINIENISSEIQKTHVPNLFVISGGIQVPNPSEILGSSRMKQLYQTLKEEFSIIIFDSPPLEMISDSLVLGQIVKQYVLVVRYGKTNLDKLYHKIIEFPDFRNEISGIVLNASPEIKQQKYAKYSYYQY